MSYKYEIVKLADVCDISSSKRIFAKEYQNTGVPFYRGKEIIELHNNKKVSNELYISEERYAEIKNKFGVPEKDDILLTSVGTLGIPYQISNKNKFYFKDGNLTWFHNFKNVNAKFVYYWLCSSDAQNQIHSKSIGSSQKAITINMLNNFQLFLPSIKVQNKIVDILASFDKKIKLNNKIVNNLKILSNLLFEAFIASKEFKKCKLFDIAKVKYGKGLSKNNLQEKGYPVFGGNGLIGNYDSYLYEYPQILVSCRGAASGKIIISMPKSFVTSNSLIVELNDYNYFEFYKQYFLAHPLYSYTTGSAQPQITIDNLEKIEVPYYDLNLLLDLNMKLSNISKLEQKLLYENEKLSQIRDLYLNKIFNKG